MPAARDPRGPAAAAYAELAREVAAAGAHVVEVCGTVAEDRGEQVAAGLAVALAAPGRKVAVVEPDPARPALRRLFALPRGPGWAELSRGEATLDDAAAAVPGVPGLAVVAAGADAAVREPPAGPIPSEAGAGGVLAALRDRFDLVVVAGPPLLDGARPASVPPDAILLAVALERIRRSRRPRLRRAMGALPAPVLGYVLLTPAASAEGAHELPRGRREAHHRDGEEQEEHRVVG